MWKFNLPNRQQLEQYKILQWMKPLFNRTYLWHWSRRGVAMGAAIGVFFGFLIPAMQIPFAAGSALWLRAHLPTAVVSTLITNPITVTPIYFAAYQVGDWLYDTHEADQLAADTLASTSGRAEYWWAKISKHGKPLLTGLFVFAILGAVFTYYLINVLWRMAVWKKRRQPAKNR